MSARSGVEHNVHNAVLVHLASRGLPPPQRLLLRLICNEAGPLQALLQQYKPWEHVAASDLAHSLNQILTVMGALPSRRLDDLLDHSSHARPTSHCYISSSALQPILG